MRVERAVSRQPEVVNLPGPSLPPSLPPSLAAVSWSFVRFGFLMAKSTFRMRLLRSTVRPFVLRIAKWRGISEPVFRDVFVGQQPELFRFDCLRRSASVPLLSGLF